MLGRNQSDGRGNFRDVAWLREFDADLDEWRTLLEIVEATLHYIRREGYHRAAVEQLAALLTRLSARHGSKAVEAWSQQWLGQTHDSMFGRVHWNA